MYQSYIFYLFILKEYLTKLFGTHFPREIIKLIIMIDYRNIIISCGRYSTILMKDGDIYTWVVIIG